MSRARSRRWVRRVAPAMLGLAIAAGLMGYRYALLAAFQPNLQVQP